MRVRREMTDDHKERDAAATNGQDDGVVDDRGKAACNVGCEEASRGINDIGWREGKRLDVFDSLKRLSESDLAVHNNKIRCGVEP